MVKEPNQELSPRAKRYQELDRLAFELGPAMDEVRLFSLKFEEISYVLGMAYLYMLARLGAISPETGAKIKRQFILRTERIHNGLIIARYMYHRQQVNTITYSKDMNELTHLINSGSPVAFPKALEIIDTLSGSYIFSTLYNHSMRNMDLDQYISETEISIESKEKLQAVLSKLLNEMERDALPDVLAELTEEDLRELSNRIPTKEIKDSNIPKELLLKP